MATGIRSLGIDTYAQFFYWVTHPNMLSDLFARATENLFATKTIDGAARPDPQFTKRTFDLSNFLDRMRQSHVNPDLHCKGNQIYCRDYQHIFILNACTDDIDVIPIADSIAVHIQNGMACIVKSDRMIEVINLATKVTVAHLQSPDYLMVRSTYYMGHYKNYDIQISDSHLYIGYHNNRAREGSPNYREARDIVWNYRTGNILDQIQPLPKNFHDSSAPTLLTEDAFFSRHNTTLRKWDLHNPDRPSLIVEKEDACSLSIFNGYLFAGKNKYLTVYHAEDLSFSHKTNNFHTIYKYDPVLVKKIVPFGNTLLCYLALVLSSYLSGYGIGVIKITDNILEKDGQVVLKEIDGSQIYAINTFGIGKLVVGTKDMKVHVLDFLL